MNLQINNKHNIGDTVSFFESTFTHANGMNPASSETIEKQSKIKKIIVTITESEIEWEYQLDGGQRRNDNTILVK